MSKIPHGFAGPCPNAMLGTAPSTNLVVVMAHVDFGLVGLTLEI
jgi:hypothetical protein